METVYQPAVPVELPSLDEILAEISINVDKLLDPKEGLIARINWS